MHNKTTFFGTMLKCGIKASYLRWKNSSQVPQKVDSIEFYTDEVDPLEPQIKDVLVSSANMLC